MLNLCPWRLRAASVAILCCLASAAGAERAAAAAAAATYEGKTLRIHAHYEKGRLRADRVQWRTDQEDPERVQLTGVIRRMDLPRRRFLLGGVPIRWLPDAEIRDLGFTDLRDGVTVRVTGEWAEDELIAQHIRAAEPMDARTLQITAVVDEARAGPDGSTVIALPGIEVLWTGGGYNTVESLIRRQDQRGSDAPATRQLLGRDFGITGKTEASTRERRDYDFADTDQVVDTEATFELGAYYRLAPRTTVYAAVKASYTADLLRAGGGREAPQTRIERDQSWIHFDRIGGSGLALQLGRQNFKESREWWWDDDLDAARLYVDRGPWHAELGIARELAPLSNQDEGIDPEQRGVTRILGQASWLWAPRQKLEAFFLHADDRSGVDASEDESDARLTWFGLRVSGQRDIGRYGTLNYWADQAWVSGQERQIDFRDVPGGVVVDSIADISVSGRGLDVGVAWQAPWRHALSLGVGYARGSAGPGAGDVANGGFRQTGLHRNKTRLFGVNRYRNYGEVLRPELSNLAIQTATLGLPLRRNSSLELAWHRYRQLTPSGSLRDARIDAELDGRSTDVGSALDLIIGLRDSRYVDVALTIGLFRAGSAYGVHAGEMARQVALEAEWSF